MEITSLLRVPLRPSNLSKTHAELHAGRKIMACLMQHSKPKAPAGLAGMDYVIPYTTRLAMPDAMTLRLDFTGHDRILGALQSCKLLHVLHARKLVQPATMCCLHDKEASRAAGQEATPLCCLSR